MKFLKPLVWFFFLFCQPPGAHAQKPVALVYEGPGSCGINEGDCTGAAERAAQFSGYQVTRVGPNALNPSSTETDYQKVFGSAAVWVQPGGHSRTFLKTATPKLKDGIRRFVSAGHGYVGFCAGAFSATQYDGNLDVEGLNLIGGHTRPYPSDTIDNFFDGIVSYFNPDALFNQIFEVNWGGKKRDLYFEEGPSLDFTGVRSVEVTATLKNGEAIAARAPYGSGRVYITGGHPEAPAGWRSGLNDRDGLDYDLVKQMMDWASQSQSQRRTR